MDTVIFVEEIGRNGEVVRRHALERLPVRIGRGYDADVVVDDPYVAARHLEIRQTTDGGLEAVDLGSRNGTRRLGTVSPVGALRIGGNDVLRIGRTQLRVRLPGHPVPPEQPLACRRWDRHPGVFAGAVGALVGLLAWFSFLSTHGTDTSEIIIIPLVVSIVVLTWVAVWSLVCRTMHGHGNFVAHGIVAFLGGVALIGVDSLTEYIQFAFDLGGGGWVWSASGGLVLSALLYRHLRLSARAAPRRLMVLALALVAALHAVAVGVERATDANEQGLQRFRSVIKPAPYLFARGAAPRQFFESAGMLKAQADEEARATVR